MTIRNPAPEGAVCQLNDDIELEIRPNPDSEPRIERYRIGRENNFQAKPPLIGTFSAWGEKLLNLPRGASTPLAGGDNNEVYAKIIQIYRPATVGA